MSQTLIPGSILAMTDQAADRLLKLDSGDAALQYLAKQALVNRSLVNACALYGSVCSGNAELGSGYVTEGAAIGADCGTGSGTDVNVHLLFLLFFSCAGRTGAA